MNGSEGEAASIRGEKYDVEIGSKKWRSQRSRLFGGEVNKAGGDGEHA